MSADLMRKPARRAADRSTVVPPAIVRIAPPVHRHRITQRLIVISWTAVCALGAVVAEIARTIV